MTDFRKISQLTLGVELTGNEELEMVQAGNSRKLTSNMFPLRTYPYVTIGGFGGSLPESRALTAGTGITITDGGAAGNVTISMTDGAPAPSDATYVTLSTNSGLSDERVLTAGTNITIVDGGAGNPVTINAVAAPRTATYVTLSLDGALDNERVLTAGTNVAFVDGGAGADLTINVPDSAPPDASYLVLAPNSGLSDERVLTAGTNVSFVDAGGALTVNVDAGAPASATYLVLSANGDLSNERVLTAGTNVSFFDSGPGGTLTINASGGSGGSGGVIGAAYDATLTSGANNDLALPDVLNTNRIVCDTSAGAATLTGWTAGVDGQLMIVTNAGPNTLTLPNQNGGSSAQNQVYAAVNLTMTARQSRLHVYSDSLQKWMMV